MSPAFATPWRPAPTCSSRWTPTCRTTRATCPISCASWSRAPTSSWVAVRARRRRRELAAVAQGDQPWWLLYGGRAGPALPRPDRRLQVLPARRARGHRPRRDRHQRLRLSDRDDLPRSPLGFNVVELPIIFVDRKVGESKMSSDIFVEAMVNVWRLRFARLPARPLSSRRPPPRACSRSTSVRARSTSSSSSPTAVPRTA